MMTSVSMMSSLLFILHLVTYVQSFASGPPVIANPEICDDMFPSGHNVTPQTGPSPYRIIFNTNNCYSSTTLPITVTVHHERQGGFWEGLFIQARLVNGTNQSYGMFATADPKLSAFTCGSSNNNTLGQTAHEHFENRGFTWIPPSAGLTGDIEFVATIIRKTSIFWMFQKSAVLRHTNDCTTFSVTSPPLLSSTQRPTTSSRSSSHKNLIQLMTTATLSTLVVGAFHQLRV